MVDWVYLCWTVGKDDHISRKGLYWPAQTVCGYFGKTKNLILSQHRQDFNGIFDQINCWNSWQRKSRMEIPDAKCKFLWQFRSVIRLRICSTICSHTTLEQGIQHKNAWITLILRNTKKHPEESAGKCLTFLLIGLNSERQL